MGLPKEIADFMAKYKVDADEVWKIPQGSAYAVKHKALERVAAEQGIVFSFIDSSINLETKHCWVLASGKMGEAHEESFGEAAPYNNKNAYPLAMAEKRAKDRVVLKLLQVHGSIYSEDELDEPRQATKSPMEKTGAAPTRLFPEKRENPHVNRPEDMVEDTTNNIPDSGEEVKETLTKATARKDFEAAQKEMRSTKTIKQLEAWGKNNSARLKAYPQDWLEIFRGLYNDHMRDLAA